MWSEARKICKPNPYFVQNFFLITKIVITTTASQFQPYQIGNLCRGKRCFSSCCTFQGYHYRRHHHHKQHQQNHRQHHQILWNTAFAWDGKVFPCPNKKLRFEIYTPFLSLNFSSIYELVYLCKNVANTVLSVNIQSVYLESVLTPIKCHITLQYSFMYNKEMQGRMCITH